MIHQSLATLTTLVLIGLSARSLADSVPTEAPLDRTAGDRPATVLTAGSVESFDPLPAAELIEFFETLRRGDELSFSRWYDYCGPAQFPLGDYDPYFFDGSYGSGYEGAYYPPYVYDFPYVDERDALLNDPAVDVETTPVPTVSPEAGHDAQFPGFSGFSDGNLQADEQFLEWAMQGPAEEGLDDSLNQPIGQETWVGSPAWYEHQLHRSCHWGYRCGNRVGVTSAGGSCLHQAE